MDKVDNILKDKNVRPTAMRVLVLQFLLKKEVAVSLSDIENYFDNADRTTLYRSLKTFEENGIVHQIDDGTGVAKYALCKEHCTSKIHSDLHLHFHCTNCNETLCLTEHKIPHINLPDNFTAEDVNLVIKGICDKCNLK